MSALGGGLNRSVQHLGQFIGRRGDLGYIAIKSPSERRSASYVLVA